MKDYQKEIDKKEARRTELFKLREPIDLEIEKLYYEIKALKEKQTEQSLEQDMGFVEKFYFLMFEDGCSSDMKRYDAAKELINDELGLWMSGYYPETEQKAVEIMLYKGEGDNLEKTYDSLCKILPLVKPIKEGKEKRFKLFEHTLSEGGIYALKNVDEKWKLTITSCGRERDIKEWDNLKEALMYCQEHHYYESSFDEDD